MHWNWNSTILHSSQYPSFTNPRFPKHILCHPRIYQTYLKLKDNDAKTGLVYSSLSFIHCMNELWDKNKFCINKPWNKQAVQTSSLVYHNNPWTNIEHPWLHMTKLYYLWSPLITLEDRLSPLISWPSLSILDPVDPTWVS